jgi:hypothetical protein
MSIGGGEYSWIRTDTGYAWSGPGAPPGCGPGCCGGCKTQPRLFGFPVDDKFNHYSQQYIPNILSNYVTKQELENALNELRGICGMSIDKENSARCNRSKGHLGFCDGL